MKFLWSIGTVLILLCTACGGQDDITKSLAPSGRGKSSDLTKGLDCRAGSELRLADEDPRGVLRAIPAKELSVDVDGEVKTLCEIMEFSGKRLALIQFVEQRCYACLRWVEANTQDLKADAKGPDVLELVVVVNSSKELSNDAMSALRADVAPDAIWSRDRSRLLWNFFSSSRTQESEVSPLLIVMDPFGRGFYEDEWRTKVQDLLQKAQTLLGF